MTANKKRGAKRRKAAPLLRSPSGVRLVLSTSLRGALNMVIVASTSGIVLLSMFAAKQFL
jgi:hypothetical protein